MDKHDLKEALAQHRDAESASRTWTALWGLLIILAVVGAFVTCQFISV